MAVAVGLHHRAHLGGRAHRRGASRRWPRWRRGTRRPRRGPSATQLLEHARAARRPGRRPPARRPGRPRRPGRAATRRRRRPRAARRPRASRAPIDAAEHVAGAGGGEAGVAVDDHPHLPVGRGDHGGRALEQHDGARRAAARARAAASRSAPGRCAREPLELAVVRGEHGRRRHAPAATRRRRRPRAVRPSPSTTAGQVGAGEHVEHRGLRGGARCPRPGPMTSAWTRSAASSAASAQPAAGQLQAHRLGGASRVVDARPGEPRRTMPAPARWAAAAARCPAPGHRRPSRRSPARRPTTCGRSAAAAGSQPRDVGAPRRRRRWAGRRRGRCRRRRPGRPASGPARAPARASAPRTSRCARRARARPRSSPVRPVDAARDVDGQHGRAARGPGAWCSPRKPVP